MKLAEKGIAPANSVSPTRSALKTVHISAFAGMLVCAYVHGTLCVEYVDRLVDLGNYFLEFRALLLHIGAIIST